MSGFVGTAGQPLAMATRVVARMLRAGVAESHPSRASGAIGIFGRRDVDLASERDVVVAIAGYAHRNAAPVSARQILDLWGLRGVDLLSELDGEHSIAVSVGEMTVVARDRYGSRPLYVADLDKGGVGFSTAIGPLLTAGVPPDPNRDAIVRSLALGYVPAPETALARVAQVPAGEAWTLSPRRKITRWYSPRERIDGRRSFARASSELDAAVTEAVARALPATGRVGAFLSGGLDSSLILARARETGRDVEAFTLHFGDDLPSELPYAAAVAKHVGARHRVMDLDARAFVHGIAPALMHLEDSLTEPIAVPNFLLAREAARTCDVLFTGEGGDPSFGGPKNIGMVLAHAYRDRPLAPSLPEAYMTSHHHLADDLPFALTDDWRKSFDSAAFARMLSRHVEPRRGSPRTSFVGGLMRANLALKGASNILVKVAKMVGAHDVALRSPLFDRAVVELALTIPPWQKLWGTDEKMVMKRAARRSLPDAVVDRPKRGMAVPLRAWLKGSLGELARDTLTKRAVRDRGIFRWDYVERLLRLERLPSDLARSRSPEKLWLVLVTELHLGGVERLSLSKPA